MRKVHPKVIHRIGARRKVFLWPSFAKDDWISFQIEWL